MKAALVCGLIGEHQMSIRFTCQLTDPDTEALLIFLEKLTANNESRMLEVLDCAKEWLKLDAPTPSHRGESHMSTSLLLVDDSDDPTFSSPSHTPVQSQVSI
jgi:hypothetical protein